MCTLILLRRSGHDEWPILIAANRDELAGRPSLAPARHWEDREDVVAGMDVQAGGSWLGVNDHGLVAAILNRRGTLGPLDGKRSRGELVLDALDHADANISAQAMAGIDPHAYRPFNLIIADNRDAFWVRHAGDGSVSQTPIPDGYSAITAGEMNDPASARIRRYKPLFAQASVPDPNKGDWSDWQLLLGSKASETDDPMDALCIRTSGEYGTRSSSLIALPGEITKRPVWQFADGPPDQTAFKGVEI